MLNSSNLNYRTKLNNILEASYMHCFLESSKQVVMEGKYKRDHKNGARGGEFWGNLCLLGQDY